MTHPNIIASLTAFLLASTLCLTAQEAQAQPEDFRDVFQHDDLLLIGGRDATETPNLEEITVLLGKDPNSTEDRDAARQFVRRAMRHLRSALRPTYSSIPW